jgi:hypothetical protein
MRNKDNESKVFKNNGKITIPKQLREYEGARFILIDRLIGKGKKPKQKKWTTEKNYSANDPILTGYIRGGGNYGIATGFGWLHCFDADEVKRLRELCILDKLPKTLTIETGGKGDYGEELGRHYWYMIEGLRKRITFYDPELKDKDNDTEFLHLGEVQSMGNYAIGPNSLHYSGKRYKIIDNSPIAKLSYQELIEILKPLRTKKKDDRPTGVTREGKICNLQDDIDISKIGWPRGNVEKLSDGNYRGTHPFHDSKNGRNFSIHPSKGVWYCFKHDSGGGWKELLAVKEGIISCEHAGKGCLSRQQTREVMQKAEQMGLLEEKETIDAPIAEIELDREIVDKIPRKIPNGDLVVLMAPPRTGKTHTVVQWLADNGSGNYITHTHAIVEHAIKIAKELRMKGGVWVIGMNQKDACVRHGERRCAECPLKHGPENHLQMKKEATELLKEHGILTAKDIPRNLCPYYTLKIAEESARYCFTVVNNINNIMPRNLTILDEEPVLSHFYATSMKIGTIKMRAGETSTKNFIAKSMDLQNELDRILNHRKKPALHEYALKIQEISRMWDHCVDDGIDIKDIASEIEDLLIDFNPKHREVKIEGETSDGDELSLETCVRCLGKLYRDEKNPTVAICNEPGGYRSLYILGDERKTSCSMGWKEKTKKIIVIGATKAEIFANEFGGREIIIEKFRYDDRFLVLGVDKPNIGDARGTRQAQKKKIMEIGKTIWNNSEENRRMPFMILTGSKKEQEKIGKYISGATLTRKERESGMESEYISGKPVVFFQNSVISRGLDVDQYNLLLVYGCNFAQPFWSVANPGIAAAIISDETTNSVLRISSTLRTDNHSFKLVIMQKDDMHKVKYLKNFLIRSDEADLIAKGLLAMRVGGLIKKDGRNVLQVVQKGINFETGKDNLLKTMSEIDEVFDEKETESMMAAIVKLFETKRKAGIKVLNSTKVYKAMKNASSEQLVRAALQELHFKKILVMETHGKAKKWSLSRIH